MDTDVLNILKKIYEYVKNEGTINIYKGTKKLLSTEKIDIKKINSELKKKITPPKKNIKIFLISYGISLNKNWKPSKLLPGPFYVICKQFTLTEKMKLKKQDDDGGQSIIWTIKELKNIGFKKIHIKKIITAVNKQVISLIPNKKITISKVLKNLDKYN